MRLIYKYILFLYLLLTTYLQLYAFQETFRSLSVQEGMTDLVVNSIYKDARGFVWFGTNSSLEKFDGIRLKRYDINMSDNNRKRVYSIIENPSYGFLCGTGGGLFRFDSFSDKFVPFFRESISSKVNAMYSFSLDTLLVASDEGLYVCNKENVRKVLFNSNLFSSENKLTGITMSRDSSSVWLSTMNGVIWYQPSTSRYERFECKINGLSNSFYNVASIGNFLYLGTMERGIMRFDTRTHEFSNYIDVGCSVISSLSSDGKDLLYVGTDGNGVHFISVEKQEIVKSYRHVPGRKDGIRSNSVYSVLVDRDGLLWTGLYQLGVDYTLYQSGLFGVYKWKDKFTTKDMPIRTISFNGKQRLIGSRDGLVFIDESRDIVRTFNVPELRANMIISSCFFDGLFYVGTYGGGMYTFNPITLSISDFPKSVDDETFISGHIFSIRPDYEGNLWIGTSSGLYCFKDGEQVHHFTSAHSKIPDGNVYEIFFDSSRKGWICTESGVCLWEPSLGAIRNNVFPDGFVNDSKIRTVYETADGELYFLPEKGNVFCTDVVMDKFFFVDSAPIFSNKQFLSVIEDNVGGIFITTNNGLYRVDSCKNVIPYNFTDGIPDPIFTNCTAVRDSSGMFWFGNSKGLIYLKSDRINSLHKHPYRIEITDVMVNGKASANNIVRESCDMYSLEMDNSTHNLKVLFSGLIYSDPSYMIYEYCLDNSDSWKPLHGTSEISLFDVKKSTLLMIRRAGYPESQVSLYINVRGNNIAILTIVCIVITCSAFIYIFRKKAIRITVGNLKRLILWLQQKEKRGNDLNNISDYSPEMGDNLLEDSHEDDMDSCADDSQSYVNDDKYKNYKLSDEECKRLMKILDKEMIKNKLYTNKSLKIADLAVVANTSSHALSYVFNQYLQKSYYDYINEYRVEEFKSAINEEKFSRYTLEALSEHCGFSSRASFFRSFKKVTGITPNEYIKNIKSGNKSEK